MIVEFTEEELKLIRAAVDCRVVKQRFCGSIPELREICDKINDTLNNEEGIQKSSNT